MPVGSELRREKGRLWRQGAGWGLWAARQLVRRRGYALERARPVPAAANRLHPTEVR